VAYNPIVKGKYILLFSKEGEGEITKLKIILTRMQKKNMAENLQSPYIPL